MSQNEFVFGSQSLPSDVGVPKRFQKMPISKSQSVMFKIGLINPCGPSNETPGACLFPTAIVQDGAHDLQRRRD